MIKKIGILIGLIFLGLSAQAKLTKYQVLNSQKNEHSYKDACSFFQVKEAPLIESPDIHHLDCMGKKVKVVKFCEYQDEEERRKALRQGLKEGPPFIRGYVDLSSKKVICESAERVVLKYECIKEKSGDPLCKESKSSCEDLQKILAKNLRLHHHSLVGDAKHLETLSCYFLSEAQLSLPLEDDKYLDL